MIRFALILGALVGSPRFTRAAPALHETPVFPTNNYISLATHPGTTRLATRETTSNIIEDEGQVVYTTNITIDRIAFNLVVDTGSDVTWVTPDKYTCRTLQGETCKIGNAHIDVADAEVAGLNLGEYVIGYGDKSNASGFFVDRPLSVAGVTIPSQAVLVATSVFARNTYAAKWMDGFLGLGPGKTYPSPFFNALATVGLEVPQFSIALFGDADVNPSHLDGGLLAFGGYPVSLTLTSDWAAAPLIMGSPYDQWYTINVDSYMLNGKRISNQNVPLIVDSGVTITKLPKAVANEVFKLLPGKGSDPLKKCDDGTTGEDKCLYGQLWKIPCNGEVPSFSVVIGGAAFEFQPDNLNVLWYGENFCVAGIRPMADEDNEGILAFSFMKNDIVVVHDYTNTKKPQILMATYKDTEN